MDRIDLFRVFVRVVETASFTQAAASLGMPRSSVSAAIAELEDHVGTRLLHRTTRKVSSTLDGTAFYERCLHLIDEIEETESLFRPKDAKPKGKLRIDLPGRIARRIVAPALPDFLQKYPDIDIEMGVSDRVVDLVESGTDCALRIGKLQDSTLIARPMGQLSLINVASPAYLEKYGIPLTPDDLCCHWVVNYASPTTARIAPWEWVEKGQIKTIFPKSRVTVNNAESYIACSLAGLGLIQIPAYDVRNDIQQQKLVEIMDHYQAEAMPMALVYPHRQHLSRRIQVFAYWLESLLKNTMTVKREG